MWCKGHNGPYPVWLQVGTAARAILVAARPGAPFLSRHIRERTEEIKANHKRQAYGNQVCQSRWNSAHVLWEKQHIRWLSMADEGGPHTQIRLPRCDPNYAASRHSSVVCKRQKDHHHRANSAMGGRLRRGPRTKVLGTEGGMPGSWLENLVIPSWSGMPGISCPFRLEMLKAIGICGATRKRAVRTLGETAEKASCWIWQLWDIKEWKSHNTQWEKHQLHCGPTNSRVSWF